MVRFPRCPFVRPGSDVSICTGFEPVDATTDDLGVGDEVRPWQTCRHLGAEAGPHDGAFYPACHHPEAPMVVAQGKVLMGQAPRSTRVT